MRARTAPILAVLVLGSLDAGFAAASTIILPELTRTAESAALGDAGAYLRGISSLGVNPAGLAVTRPEVVAQGQTFPLQASAAMLGAAVPISALDTTIGVSYLSFRSAGFDGRNEFGESNGAFSDSEQLYSLSAARRLFGRDSDRGIYVGASVKAMSMNLAGYRAQAMAFDVGARWALRRAPLSLGVSAVNLGAGPRFLYEASLLPASYILSGAFYMGKTAVAIANVSRNVNEGRTEGSFGMQYIMGGLVALRARMGASSNGEGTVAIANITGGFGLSVFGGQTLDYSFQPYASALRENNAAGTHRLTLTVRFGSSAPKTAVRDAWDNHRGAYLIGTW